MTREIETFALRFANEVPLSELIFQWVGLSRYEVLRSNVHLNFPGFMAGLVEVTAGPVHLYKFAEPAPESVFLEMAPTQVAFYEKGSFEDRGFPQDSRGNFFSALDWEEIFSIAPPVSRLWAMGLLRDENRNPERFPIFRTLAQSGFECVEKTFITNFFKATEPDRIIDDE